MHHIERKVKNEAECQVCNKIRNESYIKLLDVKYAHGNFGYRDTILNTTVKILTTLKNLNLEILGQQL